MPLPDHEPGGLSRLLRDVQGPPHRRVTLSVSQETAWVLDPLPEGSYTTRSLLTLRLIGELDEEALRRSFAELQQRHEILRGVLEVSSGRPALRVLPSADLPWRVREDTRESTSSCTEAPLHVSPGESLWGVELVRIGAQEHLLSLEFHQILLDSDSLEIVLDEVTEHYAAFASGSDPWLGPVGPQYSAISTPDRPRLDREAERNAREHFRNELRGSPQIALPPQFPKSDIAPLSGWPPVEISLDERLSEQVRSRAETEDLSVASVLLAAVAAVLYRYGGESDLLIAHETSIRMGASEATMIGPLTNVVPLRLQWRGQTNFQELTQICTSSLARSRSHRRMPYEDALRSRVETDLPAPVLSPRVVFGYRGRALSLPAFNGVQVQGVCERKAIGQFALWIDLCDGPQGITARIHFDARVLERETVARFGEHFLCLLQDGLAHSTIPITRLSLLPGSERALVVEEWNHTDHPFRSDLGIHQLFENQAERRPEAIALCCGRSHLTYGELNALSNQVALRLRTEGVGCGTPVAVWRERSMELIIAILGIVKSGGSYVPLHPDWPIGRVQQILDRVGAVHLLTQSDYAPRLKVDVSKADANPQLLLLRSSAEIAMPWSIAPWNTGPIVLTNLSPAHTPDSPAYILFTSGSTGIPKGVLVSHRAVVNTLEWVNRVFRMGPSDRVLFVTSICFDLSVYDIFGLLAAGGSIHVATEDEVRDPGDLLSLLTTEPITFWNSAPAFLTALMPFLSLRGEGRMDRLRLIFLSGDWIPVSLPDQVRGYFRSAEVVSLGGATEAAIWSNFHRIDQVDPARSSIPYGKPIQNAQYYVLDDAGEPCPIGAPGELFISGVCLASGYLNDPDQTALKFRAHPFRRSDAGARIYATGDLSRWWPDGSLEFLGRRDQQVKIRGFRIELEEVETVLRQHPSVQDCAVVVRGGRGEEQRLVAVVVPATLAAPVQWREHLALQLPPYMVPEEFLVCERIALTQNGKVDRHALTEAVGLSAFSSPASPSPTVPSWSPLAARLKAVWESVLGVVVQHPEQTFFELGGNSLKAGILVARLKRTLRVKVPLRVVFDHPTIPLMVTHLADLLRKSTPTQKSEVNDSSSSRRAA